MRPLVSILLSLLAPSPLLALAAGPGACPAALAGGWRGEIPLRLFEARVAVARLSTGRLGATIAFSDTTESAPVWERDGEVGFQSADRDLSYRGQLSDDGSAITGFIAWGDNLVQLTLPSRGAGRWQADWSGAPIAADHAVLDLYFDSTEGGAEGGYFFFRDQRLAGLWGEPIRCDSTGTLSLRERTTGMQFTGRLAGDTLRWEVAALGTAPVVMTRIPDDEPDDLPPDAPMLPPSPSDARRYAAAAPADLDDGWATARPGVAGIDADLIGRMVAAIRGGEWNYTHSVLVAVGGNLVVDEYFHGFDVDTWHDLRSASKTVASILAGLAIEDGYLPGTLTPVVSELPYRWYRNADPRKFSITVQDLLTMSSGLDADDSRRNSVAGEGTYQSQDREPDWVRLAMDAPMLADPGSQPLYGGANPTILGGVLAHVLPVSIERYAQERLLGPLGINGYRWKATPTGEPYFGGGMYLRPLDFAKLGQLYLDHGAWQGRQLLNPNWVDASWASYGRLAPLDRNGHEYGYLWWHHRYDIGGRVIETREARGSGGQYLIVAPELDLVAVITSGNFRTGGTRRPEELFATYILPAVLR